MSKQKSLPSIPNPHSPLLGAQRPSHAPLLGWPTAVVRNRRAVDDGGHFQSGCLKRADGGLAPSAGATDEHAHLAHAVLHRLARGTVSGQASRIRRALARALEACCSRGAPGKDVAVWIGDGHDGVVEAGLDVGIATRHVLTFAAANS